MSASRQRLTLSPRNLRVGDLLQKMNDDFTIGYRAVLSVEAIRPHGATRYKVVLDDDPHPIYLAPNAKIEVAR